MKSKDYHVTFNFTIDRFLNLETKELVNQVSSEENEDDFQYLPINLNVEGRYSFRPGRYSGPPEYCYPDESEAEILSLTDPDGQDWTNQISEEEQSIIIDSIAEQVYGF